MTTEIKDKKHTITLTDERPVIVRDWSWPVVAKASEDTDHNNQELFRRYYLRVRLHAKSSSDQEKMQWYGALKEGAPALAPDEDGRCLVYGWYESSHQFESGSQAGYRATMDNVVEIIRKVGERIGAPEHLIDECVADLPVKEEN